MCPQKTIGKIFQRILRFFFNLRSFRVTSHIAQQIYCWLWQVRRLENELEEDALPPRWWWGPLYRDRNEEMCNCLFAFRFSINVLLLSLAAIVLLLRILSWSGMGSGDPFRTDKFLFLIIFFKKTFTKRTNKCLLSCGNGTGSGGTVTGLSLDNAPKLTSTWLHSYYSNWVPLFRVLVSGKQRNNSRVHYNGASECPVCRIWSTARPPFRLGFLILGWEHLTTISLSVKAKL